MQPPKPLKAEEAEDTLQAGELKRFVIQTLYLCGSLVDGEAHEKSKRMKLFLPQP